MKVGISLLMTATLFGSVLTGPHRLSAQGPGCKLIDFEAYAGPLNHPTNPLLLSRTDTQRTSPVTLPTGSTASEGDRSTASGIESSGFPYVVPQISNTPLAEFLPKLNSAMPSATAAGCVQIGHPCTPSGYPKCCIGKCVLHLGSTRIGYMCLTGY